MGDLWHGDMQCGDADCNNTLGHTACHHALQESLPRL